MENKSELLNILNYTSDFSNTTKLSDLIKDAPYDIVELRKIDTRYGPSIIATLRIGEDENTNVFLPKRYVNKLNDNQIKLFNENNFQMKYQGGKYHDIRFL